ncbi:MAG: SIR2 family protein [Thermoanaerobaculia bacterium]
MLLSANLTTRLLGAIETDSLVFLCGAGLSVPLPSDLPSAVKVAQKCYDTWFPTEALDPALRDDVDLLAKHFYARGDFEKVFIRLVPWDDLVGLPNQGHAAIADLLISQAAHAALSANFDTMIERWAEERKVAMQGALTGQEAVEFSAKTKPLIKFHGCLQRDRKRTLWTKDQLTEPAIQARVTSCSHWMAVNLPGMHLVVVGFWTDWGYLNDVLGNALSIDNASSVTVIDPSSTADLQAKAPDLWAKLNSLSTAFEHVQASGADALDELRTTYSRTWVKRFYALGHPLITAAGGAISPEANPDTASVEELYNLRRDAEGVPYNRAATRKEPAPSAAQAALAHMLLLNAGATKQGAWLEHGGQLIRVVNGAGQALVDVQGRYREPTTVPQSHIVVCAGAIELGVPGTIIPSGRGASVMRPTPGGAARWLTLDKAQMELGL